MTTGNTLTTIVLLLCPFVFHRLFAKRRLEEAVVACILGAALLLPEKAAIDPPLLPRFDKHSITALSVFIGLWLGRTSRLSQSRPLSGPGLFIIGIVLASVGTALTNSDPIVRVVASSAALTPYDAFSSALEGILNYGLPFVVGRAAFRDPRGMRVLIIALVGWALFYTVFALIEIRMSPQMHTWVYGYMQHSFAQTVRGGSYRPMVFMQHGLAVGILFTSAIIFAVGLRGQVQRIGRLTPTVASVYLFVVLVLCHSLGALLLATVGALVVHFMKPRGQMRVAATLAALVFIYPFLRLGDAAPTDTLAEWAQSVGDADREESLQFRFDHEDLLMERLMERPLFGWGGFGRGEIYDEYGKNNAVTDSHWMVVLSSQGVAGLACVFGLLTLPFIIAARRFDTITSPQDRAMLATLTVGLAFAMADLLVNGLYTRLPLYGAGALLGLMEGIPASRRTKSPAHPAGK